MTRQELKVRETMKRKRPKKSKMKKLLMKKKKPNIGNMNRAFIKRSQVKIALINIERP